MILAAKSAACWCFLAALWYFKVAEIVLNPLVGMGKMYCKLGDHHRRSVGDLWAFGGFL